MRSLQHIISTALTYRLHRELPGRTISSYAAADCGPYGASGHLNCAPWEGLYVDTNE
ncbi:hypothetical protein [Arthrobacter sp. JZ12]|uniref:hypothetical protein n=1 Tax=Arthrobacter sp. JZ12 TaxID=2654190 RepID=UPI002B475B6E|nr:hypothetical protein [Arthrobacter sp. JZ12]